MNLSRPRISSQSKSFAQKRRNRHLWLGIFTVIAIGLILWGLAYLSSLQGLQIKAIQIFGVEPSVASSTEKVAWNSIQGRYLGILQRANTLIYPKQSIISAIKEQYPNVDSVSIKRDTWNDLIVTISLKVPEAIVCTNLPDWDGDQLSVGSSDSCYFADQTGLLFGPAPIVSGHVYNRYYAPTISGEATSTDNAVIGMYATSTKLFNGLQGMYNSLNTSGITVNAILIKDNNEFEAYVGSPTTTIVYFNGINSFSDQAANLMSFWKSEKVRIGEKGKKQTFDYIDLRYAPNVFYKISQD